MKRFHVHVHVDDLARNIGFYSKLFAAEPARREADYAKWMLEDPPVNFAISTRGRQPGIDHLGIQTDDPAELAAMKARAGAAEMAVLDEGETTCCYAPAKSTGSPTRRASPGSSSTRWATFRCSTRPLHRVPARRHAVPLPRTLRARAARRRRPVAGR